MMSFQVAKGFSYRFNIVKRGKGGSQFLFLQRKKDGAENSYNCMGVPRTFGRHCRLGNCDTRDKMFRFCEVFIVW